MSSSYSSLDWVLSHWAHFTVRRFICVYVYVFCVFLSTYMSCIIVTWRGGPDGIETLSLGPISLQCFDTWLGHLTCRIPSIPNIIYMCLVGC